jgi:hypothetical protein
MPDFSFVRNFADALKTTVHHLEFRHLVEMDRRQACQAIAQRVEMLSEDEFERFEMDFLSHAVAIFGIDHRLRATELYAFLKLSEVRCFGKFRDFVTDGGPIRS